MRKASSAAKADKGRAAIAARAKAPSKSSRKPAAAAKPATRPNGPARVAKAPRAGKMTERRASERVLHGGRISPTSDTAASASRGKYVYCIIEAPDALRFGPIGIGADPSEVYTVHYNSLRSEERRVGKECKSRWEACHTKKKTRD